MDCNNGFVTVSQAGCVWWVVDQLLKIVIFRGIGSLDAEEEKITTALFGEKTKHCPQGVTCDFTTNPKSHFLPQTDKY